MTASIIPNSYMTLSKMAAECGLTQAWFWNCVYQYSKLPEPIHGLPGRKKKFYLRSEMPEIKRIIKQNRIGFTSPNFRD